MKMLYLYQIKLLDGSQYIGEITYRDEKMIVLRLQKHTSQGKLRLFYNGILSIRELGWQRVYDQQSMDNSTAKRVHMFQNI